MADENTAQKILGQLEEAGITQATEGVVFIGDNGLFPGKEMEAEFNLKNNTTEIHFEDRSTLLHDGKEWKVTNYCTTCWNEHICYKYNGLPNLKSKTFAGCDSKLSGWKPIPPTSR